MFTRPIPASLVSALPDGIRGEDFPGSAVMDKELELGEVVQGA
jgi:hypothetical protein